MPPCSDPVAIRSALVIMRRGPYGIGFAVAPGANERDSSRSRIIRSPPRCRPRRKPGRKKSVRSRRQASSIVCATTSPLPAQIHLPVNDIGDIEDAGLAGAGGGEAIVRGGRNARSLHRSLVKHFRAFEPRRGPGTGRRCERPRPRCRRHAATSDCPGRPPRNRSRRLAAERDHRGMVGLRGWFRQARTRLVREPALRAPHQVSSSTEKRRYSRKAHARDHHAEEKDLMGSACSRFRRDFRYAPHVNCALVPAARVRIDLDDAVAQRTDRSRASR